MNSITYHSSGICPLLGSEERKERQEGKSLESHFFVWLLVVVHKKFCKVRVKNVSMSPGRVQSNLQILHLHRRISPLWIPPRQWTPDRPPRASHCSPLEEVTSLIHTNRPFVMEAPHLEDWLQSGYLLCTQSAEGSSEAAEEDDHASVILPQVAIFHHLSWKKIQSAKPNK